MRILPGRRGTRSRQPSRHRHVLARIVCGVLWHLGALGWAKGMIFLETTENYDYIIYFKNLKQIGTENGDIITISKKGNMMILGNQKMDPRDTMSASSVPPHLSDPFSLQPVKIRSHRLLSMFHSRAVPSLLQVATHLHRQPGLGRPCHVTKWVPQS